MLLCAACDDSGQPTPAASASTTAEPQHVVNVGVAGPNAFDLTTTKGGAALVWADAEGLLQLRQFDAAGIASEKAQQVTRSSERIREVAAAAHEDRVGVVWLAGDGDGAAIHSSIGELNEGRFGSPLRVIATEPVELDRRGHVDISAASDGRLLAFVRGPREPCTIGGSELCASFGIRALPATSSAAMRPHLVVPTPCERGIIGVAVADGRWHYAICARDGVQKTVTVFSAQRDPAYAQAQELLAGCTPRGMSTIGNAIWLTGRCGDRRAGVPVRSVGQSQRARDMGDVSVRCEGKQPVLANSSVRIALDKPSRRLSALLPNKIAPDGARAVWTGQTLLVAARVGKQLTVSRHRCRDGIFLRD
jgi:hypothetical protein